MDPVALARAGVLLSVPPFWSAVAPDAPNDRVHFLSRQGIITRTSQAPVPSTGC